MSGAPPARALGPAYAGLACTDETDGTADGQQLSLATSLWAQQGKAFEPAFLSVLSHGYDAPLQQVDFANDASGAEGVINGWVSQETQGQIPALLQSGDVGQTTDLVLVSAVYFKGTWQNGFDPSNTESSPFTLADGTQVSVPTMNGLVTLGTGAASNAAVYELPYKSSLAMDFLVPPQSGSLAALEAGLTGDALTAALASLKIPGQVQLSLPKFSFQTRLELAPILGAMGAPDLFVDGIANLSGMDGQMETKGA